MNAKQKKFWKDYYGQLTGYTIMFHSLEVDEDSSRPWATFLLRNFKNPERPILQIEVSADEEGNDAGFLFISEPKKASGEK